MRIFAAIKPPNEIRKAIGRYIDGLRLEFSNLAVRWERTEKLHITIRFEGNMDESELEGFLQIVRSAANRPAFNAIINNAGSFMRGNGPGVLWLGISDSRDEIAEISSEIASVLSSGAGQRYKPKFNPHLTIGRLKRRGNYDALISKHIMSNLPPLEFRVSEISVFKSELTPAGSVYTEIAIFPLT